MTTHPFTTWASLDRRLRRALARDAARLAAAAAIGNDTQRLAAAAAATIAACGPAAADALVRWAEAEGLSALIAPALRPLTPGAVADGLADTAQRVTERAVVLAADRQSLAAALTAAGVPWRPLKGAWLADHAYRDAALRPMADIDIWVPREREAAAIEAIAALGYRRSAASWKHSVYAMPGDHVVDWRGEHAANPRPIEVHRRWLEGFRGLVIDIGDLRARAHSNDGEAWPDPAAMLLHVAAHASVDALGRRLRLLALVDVAVLASAASERTWHQLMAVAATPRAARFVWPSLELARRELDAPVPASVLRALGASIRAPLRRWADGIDLDDATRSGGATAPRPLWEIPRLWPLDVRESLTVMRWIAWPPRAAARRSSA